MNSSSGTLITIALLGLLAYTNPRIEDYQRFIRNQIIWQAAKDDSGQTLDGAVKNVVDQATNIRDYVFFSIYNTSIGDSQLKSIGALRNFFVMESIAKFEHAGQVFRDAMRDGMPGPEMVVIPAGEFVMGSPADEGGRDDDEKLHPVSIENAFGLGKYEVTMAEFRRFVQATNYQTDGQRSGGCSWQNIGFRQGDDDPVVCVSWNDATAYGKWLSHQTGMKYRLATEAEWEYAARAETTTAWFWGSAEDAVCRYGNVADLSLQEQSNRTGVANCKDGYVYTAPVGSLERNSFGLYGMLGNVWEWTCANYDAAYGGQERNCTGNDGDGRPTGVPGRRLEPFAAQRARGQPRRVCGGRPQQHAGISGGAGNRAPAAHRVLMARSGG